MPVFQVRQVISHANYKYRREKISEIIGRDLRHAVSMVRCPEPMRHDLQKKYWSRTTDPQGRELFIEIIDDHARGTRRRL